MRTLGFLGLGALLLALALPADVRGAADEWKYYGANEKGERFFYDQTSVIYLSPNLIQLWTRELTAEGPTKRFQEINCSYKIIRDLRVVDEGLRKAPIRPTRPLRLPSEWRAMEQDPITQQLYKTLCR
jgi:hypothetical protein